MPKRRDEWLVGRVTAKSVVRAALAEARSGDWPGNAIEIAAESGGMPYARVAPDARTAVGGFAPGERLPISVSISHADGHALCAAAWCEPRDGGSQRTLGIDLGRVEPRSREFVETFLTEAERRFVRDAPAAGLALRANLVWCAKEAALKALGHGLTVDTLDVEFRARTGRHDPAEWQLSPADGDWRPFAVACAPRLVAGGRTIAGIWRTFPGFVAALCG